MLVIACVVCSISSVSSIESLLQVFVLGRDEIGEGQKILIKWENFCNFAF